MGDLGVELFIVLFFVESYSPYVLYGEKPSYFLSGHS